MRHVVSAVLGPVLGFVAYVLFGFGVGRTSVGSGWSGDNAVGVLAIVGAGAVYAVLVVPRLSPIGPALAGIAYLALGLWIVSDVSSFVDTMPADLLTLERAGYGPGTLLLALSIPLLATLVTPSRWMSRSPTAPHTAAPPPTFGPPSAAPLDPPPFGGQPSQPGHLNQPTYPGSPPIGAPYSGPPSFGPPPGSPVAPSGYDPYGTPPPANPSDPMNPDVTRRIR